MVSVATLRAIAFASRVFKMRPAFRMVPARRSLPGQILVQNVLSSRVLHAVQRGTVTARVHALSTHQARSALGPIVMVMIA